MAEHWNRATRREISRRGEALVNEVYDRELQKVRRHSYTHAWVSMFLALVDRFGFDANMLHSIAVDTLEYTNGIEPASELADILLERTGFDIEERPMDSKLKYIEKERENEL